jgi:hypothetical protein
MATMLSQARLTLLGLPSEIRLQILETVLLYPNKARMTFVCSWSSTKFEYRWGSRLLRTCRTLYREAGTVLYGKPLFSFVIKYRSLRHEVQFLSSRIAEHVAFVEKLGFYRPDLYDEGRRTMLLPELAAFLPNLSKMFHRSHQYGDVQKGSVEDFPAVVLEDMRIIAQELGLREPEWQGKAGSVDVFIRKYIFFGACCLLKIRPLLVT